MQIACLILGGYSSSRMLSFGNDAGDIQFTPGPSDPLILSVPYTFFGIQYQNITVSQDESSTIILIFFSSL